MSDSSGEVRRKVLIASANPLFARGLQKLVTLHWEGRPAEIRIAGSAQEAADAMGRWYPNLVIVDYDEAGKPGGIQPGMILNQLIAGDRPMQVMLVSLGESGEVVVYDRRTLTPAEAEDWLDMPRLQSQAQQPNQQQNASAAAREQATADTGVHPPTE